MKKADQIDLSRAVHAVIMDTPVDDQEKLVAVLQATAIASGMVVAKAEIKADSQYGQWAIDLNQLQAVAMKGTDQPWFLQDARFLPDCIKAVHTAVMDYLKEKNHRAPNMVWGRVKAYAAIEEKAFIAAYDALSDEEKANRPRSRFPAWIQGIEAAAKRAEEAKQKEKESKKKKRREAVQQKETTAVGRTAGSMAKDNEAVEVREVAGSLVEERALRMLSPQDAALLVFADTFCDAVSKIKETNDMPYEVLAAVEGMLALYIRSLTDRVAPISKKFTAAMNRARQELSAE